MAHFAELAKKTAKRKHKSDKNALASEGAALRAGNAGKHRGAVVVPMAQVYIPPDGRSPEGFSGLKNSGATCYLNSLLQSLHMCPELRKAVFEWEYPKDCPIPDESLVPLQFQKLFGNLQASLQGGHSTKGITNSFGWKGNHVFQQQDVSEMFDVLMDNFRTQGGPLAKCVNEKYFGETMNYCKCLECGYMSTRREPFLTFRLPIDGVSNLDEAIKAYTKAETLSGDNQWFCDKCNQKRDALRGTAITRMPYVSSIMFNRWTMNWQTMQRLKLGNKMQFPEVLDMGPYLYQDESGDEAKEEAKTEDWVCPDCGIGNPKELTKCGFCDPPLGQPKEEYELFSMAIHTGGATGGHYFAYVKDFKTKTWHNFNDTRVNKIDDEHIKWWFHSKGIMEKNTQKLANERKKVLGDKPVMTSPLPGAYLLMYRKVDKKENVDEVPNSAIPKMVMDEIEKKDTAFKKQQEHLKYLASIQKFALYWEGKKQKVIEVKRDLKMGAAHKAAFEALKPLMEEEKVPDLEDTRIRDYNPVAKLKGEPYDPESEYGNSEINSMGFRTVHNVTLEVRDKGGKFETWEGVKIPLELVTLDEKTGDFGEIRYEPIKENSLMEKVRELIAGICKCETKQVGIMKLDEEAQYAIDLQDGKRLDDYNLKEMNYRLYYDVVPLDKLEPKDPKVPPVRPGQSIANRFADLINEVDVKYNDPEDEEKQCTIKIDCRGTVADLRKALAAAAGWKVEMTAIMKVGKELKNDADLLTKHHFDMGADEVYIVNQPALKKTQFRIKVYERIKAKKPKDRFRGVNVAILDKRWKPDRIRVEVRKLAREGDPKDLPWKDSKFLRLRERKANRMLGCFLDDQALDKNMRGLKDGYQLVVQPIDVEEKYTKDTLLVNLRRWQPETMTLAPAKEIALSKKMNLEKEMKPKVAEIVGIPVEHVVVVFPYPYMVKKPKEPKEAVAKLFVENDGKFDEERSLTTEKTKHGDTLVWKDAREKETYEGEKAIENAASKFKAPEAAPLKIYSYEEQIKMAEDKKKEEEATKKAMEKQIAEQSERTAKLITEAKKAKAEEAAKAEAEAVLAKGD